ncbi:MAG: hypothetical protein HS122_13990 [Opitutaceae bacterium]|nr:hypothetical protein [Opitutaceae bacterium]
MDKSPARRRARNEMKRSSTIVAVTAYGAAACVCGGGGEHGVLHEAAVNAMIRGEDQSLGALRDQPALIKVRNEIFSHRPNCVSCGNFGESFRARPFSLDASATLAASHNRHPIRFKAEYNLSLSSRTSVCPQRNGSRGMDQKIVSVLISTAGIWAALSGLWILVGP